MSLKSFQDFLIESEKPEGVYLTLEDLEKLESEIPFINKMIKSFEGESFIETFPPGLSREEYEEKRINFGEKRRGFFFFPKYSDGRNFGISLADMYTTRLSQNLRNGLTTTFKKFEEDGHCWLVPDYFSSTLGLMFDYDGDLEPGKSVMKRIYDFDDFRRVTFRYNAKTFSQLKSVIENSIHDFFDFAKKARIVLKPELIKKNKQLAKKVISELRVVYETLLDEFLENSKILPDAVEDDLFGLALIKSAKNSQEDMDFLNSLPRQALETWLKFGTDSSKSEELKVDAEFIESMEKIYNMKPIWNLI